MSRSFRDQWLSDSGDVQSTKSSWNLCWLCRKYCLWHSSPVSWLWPCDWFRQWDKANQTRNFSKAHFGPATVTLQHSSNTPSAVFAVLCSSYFALRLIVEVSERNKFATVWQNSGSLCGFQPVVLAIASGAERYIRVISPWVTENTVTAVYIQTLFPNPDVDLSIP